MANLLAFFGGRVDLELRGNQLESFINRLHREKIPLYNPRRDAENKLYCTVPARSFKRLRGPAFKTATKVKIIKKRGFFIAIRPFLRRFGILAGLAVFLGIVFFCSGFVWQIEVSGCEETSYMQILADLDALGLKIGCRNTIDVGKIENKYLLGNEKLSWMSINIRGTTAYVEVKEQGAPPPMTDASIPTNVYAARDGIILSIQDYNGIRCVQVGEAVSAGDLLVSGDWTDQYGVRRLMHCNAKVRAETRREIEEKVLFQESVRQKTGKKQKKYRISLGKWKIPLYFKETFGYNEYDTMVKVYPLRIGAFAFPIRWESITAEEIRPTVLKRSEQEARKIAQSRLDFYQSDRLADAVIYKRDVQETITKDALILSATFYCEEEIGIELPIE
ncbi:MAG: sporulation protein YqfD [Clostridia bacterium]|nr:sporulation protein YqfD [Clostridia bacterium]